MGQSTFRAFVTWADGTEGIIPANVQTPEDQQAMLNCVGKIAQNAAGVSDEDAAKLSPQRKREIAAKVQFFRVAQG